MFSGHINFECSFNELPNVLFGGCNDCLSMHAKYVVFNVKKAWSDSDRLSRYKHSHTAVGQGKKKTMQIITCLAKPKARRTCFLRLFSIVLCSSHSQISSSVTSQDCTICELQRRTLWNLAIQVAIVARIFRTAASSQNRCCSCTYWQILRISTNSSVHSA